MSRHIVLGADSFLGIMVLKLLVTIGEDLDIIAASPSGIIQTDQIPAQITILAADILDPVTLYNLLDKGDIVYNTQVNLCPGKDLETIELENYAGLINLIGIGQLLGIGKIVTALPQIEGLEFPSNIDELTRQSDPTDYHKINRKVSRMLKKYWNKDEYGWSSKQIRACAKENIEKPKYPITFYDDELEEMGLNETIDETPSSSSQAASSPTSGPTSGPTLGGPQAASTPASGPTLGGPQAASTPASGPTLGGPQPASGPTSGPTLGGSQPASSEISKVDSLKTSKLKISKDTIEIKEGTSLDEQENDVQEELSEIDLFWQRQAEETKKRQAASEIFEIEMKKMQEKQRAEQLRQRELKKREYSRVPLVLAKFSKTFGSYDRGLTTTYCDGIRSGNLTVLGPIDKKISWITPIDMARAMIIMGDKTVPFGDYFLNSFIASPLEILNELDKQNLTSCNITHLDLIQEARKIKIRNIFAKLGITKYRDINEIYEFNTECISSDEKAKKKWDWYPRLTFEKAITDAIEWFREVMVPELYPIK
ncbi:MAG: hypothetical protein INQ03_18065 [Candidatus Heimdallarchaeota archaeon]|nr:hypothetical protein [Candidatus Heimdallarchaeota archaeon]